MREVMIKETVYCDVCENIIPFGEQSYVCEKCGIDICESCSRDIEIGIVCSECYKQFEGYMREIDNIERESEARIKNIMDKIRDMIDDE